MVDSQERRRGLPPARALATMQLADEPAPTGRLHLLVIGEDLYATHPLPDHGVVVVGRQPSCDVFIDHPSVSRRHAVLEVGPQLAIVDEGSSNGTRVRDKRLAPGQRVEIAPGDLLEVGSLQLVVQQRAAPVRRRRVWTHDYFDARLEEECARCELTGATFAVVHLRGAADAAARIEDVLVAQLRTLDIIATYAPGQYEVLLCETTAAEAAIVERRLTDALASAELEVRIGTASYPDDGRDPDALIGIAAVRARGELVRAVAIELPESAMQSLRRLVERIAQGNISVLVQGETGVGKEVMAETIHNLSPRAAHPFLRLNCAALSETLLESELFGHEKGAFTGAIATKPGLLETADKGTVFLDEIGELSMSMQVKLLRVIEERRVMRVGGLKSRAIDVRFVAATNRVLETEVARGAFRQDLYFRLNGITLDIPPLRERLAELRPLAELFITRACEEGQREQVTISPDADALLRRYAWPGNIRELKHVLERAVLLCTGTTLLPEHLPVEKMRATRTVASATPPATALATTPRPTPRSPTTDIPAAPSASRAEDLDFTRARRERERAEIIAALRACDGNQSRAAAMLQMSRRTLSNKLDVHGLPRPRKR